jgi:ureidoacrylate peracid hydrolase
VTIEDPYSERRLFGRELPLEPSGTAVLVIDMLNDFCEREGVLGNPEALRLCDNQNNILDTVRRGGGTVVFVNEEHRTNLAPRRAFAQQMTHTYQGTWGADVVAPLRVEQGDLSVIKRRYSGFFQSDLDLVLRDRDVRNVILLGVLTNICVRATAHDAFFLGYDVVVPEDAVGAMSRVEQMASLYDISTHFGWVTDTDNVLAALQEGAPIQNLDRRLAEEMTLS